MLRVTFHPPVQGDAHESTSQRREKTGLVFMRIRASIRCTSFLFEKLPGVAQQGKKRCSFDVPHGRFHRSQTAGPGYGDIPDK